MKKLVATAVLTTIAALTTSAYADNTTIDVTGTAQNIAVIGSTGAPIAWGDILNADSTVTTKSTSQAFPNALINYAGYLSISSTKGGLKSPTAAAADGFTTRVDYKVEASWGTIGPISFITDGTPYSTRTVGVNVASASTGGAVKNSIGVTASTSNTLTANNAIPVVAAADYADTITVQVGASL